MVNESIYLKIINIIPDMLREGYMKKYIVLLLTIFLFVTFASCADIPDDYLTDSSELLLPIHENDCQNMNQELSSEIKTAYFRFACEKNFGGECTFQASDIFVSRYEGEVGSGHIVMMGGDGMMYTQAFRSVHVAGYTFCFSNGQPVYVYRNGYFYTVEEAYEANIISKSDVYQIATVFDSEFSAGKD
jgi:hypothetical protein